MKQEKYTLLLNDGGDLELDGEQNLVLVVGAEEINQNIRLLLSTAQGEWFLNTNHGTDYAAILGENWPEIEDIVRHIITEGLKQESRIKEIIELNLDFSYETRILNIQFTVDIKEEIITGSAEVSI